MHQIEYNTYHCSVSQKKIEKELNKYAERYSDYGGGLPSPIKWHKDVVCKNVEEAMEWVREHDSGWYDQIAVYYKEGRKKFWFVKIEFHC